MINNKLFDISIINIQTTKITTANFTNSIVEFPFVYFAILL